MATAYLKSQRSSAQARFKWQGKPKQVPQPLTKVRGLLGRLDHPLYVLSINGNIFLEETGYLIDDPKAEGIDCLGVINPCQTTTLGDSSFLTDYNLDYAYYAGAMANGINSVEMVVALGKCNILSSFGAGGLTVEQIKKSIDEIMQALPNGPYAINLLHNPGSPDWEMACVKYFIEKKISLVEASAYINLSPAIVYYRVVGLSKNGDGNVLASNRIIAKVSRPEVARQFLQPAPVKILNKLIKNGLITEEQKALAMLIPMADDITVESDSGGHTDHGVLACIFPQIVNERNIAQANHGFTKPTRIGAAGGIGMPSAVYSAFSLGAAFVATGSINQACIEAGTSTLAKDLLKQASVSDVASAPSADMFEIGAKVQVLKSNSMYAVRSQKLYNLYKRYDSINDLPKEDLTVLEKQFFHKPLSQVWEETKSFFLSRDMADQINLAEKNPKRKMALLFQSYLGQSSKWAIDGSEERKIDFQIWCGPSMGACNNWLAGSIFEKDRSCVDLAINLMTGSAYLARMNGLKLLGVAVPFGLEDFRPQSRASLSELAKPHSLELVTESNASTNSAHKLSDENYQQATNHRGTNMENVVEETKKPETRKLTLTKSKEYYKKTWELLPGGAHYNFADPERALVIPFNRGRGSRVWDLDGNEHLDMFCKFGALFVGHHNETYNQALMKYMGKVTSVDTCDLEVEVCERLVQHIPCAEMVRFSLSGTEAVQNALRLARAYTGKNRFIRFHGHYHGNADNVMGGRKKKNLSWPTPEMFRGDMLDTLGRATNILEDQSFMLPWNDIDVLENAINQYGKEIAAVLMEPICMNGGGILPCSGYLEKAKELCEKNNIVLIFDEIITGVRLGLGGAQKILGVTPHLSTFAKALAGGSLPVSALAGHKDIMNLYTKGKVIHAGTFNGYPLGLAAINATYEIIENDPGCYERMGGIMAKICKIFIKSANQIGLPMVVQGMPTALVYHSQKNLVDRSEGYTDKVKFCDIIIREVAKRHGLQFSPLSRLYPNLLINDDDVKFFEARIFDAMANAKQLIDITFKEEELA